MSSAVFPRQPSVLVMFILLDGNEYREGKDYGQQEDNDAAAQIECRLIEVRIHLPQSWHHTQNNVWQTEGDMREYHGSIPLRNAQRDEEQEERDTDDDNEDRGVE